MLVSVSTSGYPCRSERKVPPRQSEALLCHANCAGHAEVEQTEPFLPGVHGIHVSIWWHDLGLRTLQSIVYVGSDMAGSAPTVAADAARH